MSIKKTLVSLPVLVITLLITFYTFLRYHQSEQYFYYPDNTNYGQNPNQYGQEYEELWIPTQDGEKLNAWFIPTTQHDDPKDALGTILHYHGNAANMTGQYHGVSWLPDKGFNVITFDYRGFGQSTGKPSFNGVYKDGIAALEFVNNFKSIDNKKIYIIGQSLGGNVSIVSIAKTPNVKVNGLLADSTFYGYKQIANEKVIGAKWIVRDTYSAYKYLRKLKNVPILYLHGTADRVIPFQHSEQLFNRTKGERELMILPKVEHISGMNQKIVQDIVYDFFTDSH